MPAQPSNPFADRKMLKNEAAFHGREGELRDILARLRSGNAVSLVGPRRIGKSSLLYHLYLTGNHRLGDSEGKGYRFIYLDATDAELDCPLDFARQVLKLLGVSWDTSVPESSPRKALGR